jgi:hypothetical protein
MIHERSEMFDDAYALRVNALTDIITESYKCKTWLQTSWNTVDSTSDLVRMLND